MERRVLGGRYELLEPVGGSSWHARDTELERDVLVRLGERAADPAVALSHPNIARVYDSGQEDGEPYAVLEYLPGGTLAARGELDDAATADVAAALAYAHSLGVAHGSLTASSILFDAEGRAKVVGFGGEGDPAEDLAALDALVREYEGTAVAAPPPEEPTTLIQPPPPAPQRRRRGALVLVAVALAAAGVAAAFLVAFDDSTADRPTGSLSIESPPSSAEPTTEEPPPPSTTEQSTTEKTTTATTEPPPTTTSEPLPTVTVPPIPTTVPPPTTEPPPPTTEPPPPTEEPPPGISTG